MLIAVAAKAAAETHWWDDWPKFAPGWLAFAITIGTLIHKWWTRRHKMALGPDDEAVREALTTARTLFNEIITRGGFDARWFQDEDRRDTGQRLLDLAARRDDEQLRIALTNVAECWNDAFGNSPPRRAMVSVAGAPEHPSDRMRREEDTKTRGRQVESAREGIRCVEAALKRLNKLERRIVGR
ncbi:hypothetical protein [Streptomyces sp. NPDC058739]|uniref:hypothetical protein n=1 Tax=Streptomyces sp. NPDC058739 TaxID=3346618 RepID=UPI0036A4BCBF